MIFDLIKILKFVAMAEAAVYLQALRLSPVILSGHPFLKLYVQLSQPDLSLVGGQFTYTDQIGHELTLPLLSLTEGIMLAQLEPNVPYSGTLELHFATGEVLIQKLGFALLPWLAEIDIHYQALMRAQTFKGSISLKVSTDAMEQVDHFELQCPLLNQGQLTSLDPNSASPLYFQGLIPEQEGLLQLTRVDFDSSKHQAHFELIVPNLSLTHAAVNAANLGYGKWVDADSVQESYHLPYTKNILAHEAEWQLHEREASSLSDTHLLQVKSVISADAGHYLERFDRSDHHNYLDYQVLRDQGIAAGPNTAINYTRNYQGKQVLLHEGQFTHERKVQTDQLELHAPQVNYQYGTRTTTLRGQNLVQESGDYQEITGTEQSFIQQHTEATPHFSQSVDQSTEAYDTQNFNAPSIHYLADELHHNGLTVIHTDRFELSDYVAAQAPKLIEVIPLYSISIDIANALFLSVAPSGLICLIKLNLSGELQAKNSELPVPENDPSITGNLQEAAKNSCAELILSLKLAGISSEGVSGPHLNGSLNIAKATLSLADGQEFSCSLNMKAPNIYSIENEALNIKGKYQAWELSGSTLLSADLIFIGKHTPTALVSVVEPSRVLRPYPYQAEARQLIKTAQAFLTTATGQSALQSALASGGNPFLAIFNFALHESVQQYGMKKTLERVGLGIGLMLAAGAFYLAPELVASAVDLIPSNIIRVGILTTIIVGISGYAHASQK